MLSTLGEIIRDLLLAVGIITVLVVGIIIVIMKMPVGNPLKRLLTALCFRLGATAAAAVLAVPIEPIPGLDVLYDIGAPILLLLYWISFFKNAHWTSAPHSPRSRTIGEGRSPHHPPRTVLDQLGGSPEGNVVGQKRASRHGRW